MSGTGCDKPIHEHCAVCVRRHCHVKPDEVTSCALIYCDSGCGQRLHSCKAGEHRHVCLREKVPCINKEYGCPQELVRQKMSDHLPVCPASVIFCPMEWNRWPMHSQDEGWKAPLPFKNPHVKCGQLDVAFALRDQNVLMESFKSTPKKTCNTLLTPLSTGYPAVPIESFSSTIESPTSESSQMSDDDSGTPWDLNKSPPGLRRTIYNQLAVDSRMITEKKVYAASRQATESLTSALDYVTGKQGLKRLAEIAAHQRAAEEKLLLAMSQTESVDDIATTLESVKVPDAGQDTCIESVINNAGDEEEELQVYYQKKKLFEILGLDLRMYFISPSQPKPNKMFTFLCGQEFRRDEFSMHYKNFHSDIQCNLDNWFEQRCPLSYAGCTFSFQRLQPSQPSGSIVHSPVLHSIGFLHGDEFEKDENLTSGIVPDNHDFQTLEERRKLREATPEIHTSYKCDSNVNVIPRYKSMSQETSPVKIHEAIEEHTFPLTDLPFEVLQNIALNLDGFSLLHLALSCKLLNYVCCSLLPQRGVVSFVWRKSVSADSTGAKSKWDITHKRWHFSKSFEPVQGWSLTEGSLAAVHEHLKVCPYNQDHVKNMKTEPFQICPHNGIWHHDK